MNATHAPTLTSWVSSAQHHPDFPIQNLPLGVFRRRNTSDSPRVGVAIGDEILDLTASADVTGVPAEPLASACAQPTMNQLLALGRSRWSELRNQVSALLAAGSSTPRRAPDLESRILVPMREAEMFVPAEVGDYTDFYASIHHASNVGSLFRPENPLLPNYKWVPIGYHGRASSLVISGTPVRRPKGQIKNPDSEQPVYRASQALDYEAEIGCFVGPGNALGETVPLAAAEDHLFGLCLVNDWSARDIQSWEYQPLGPFLAKSFATTVSPWVVTLEALEPFRVPAYRRPIGDPEPLPYLAYESERLSGGIDAQVEVFLCTAGMREAGAAPVRLSSGRLADLYWTMAQMFTHHTSNGCNMRPGDLFASGTISGPTEESRGCLLELTRRGADPVSLPNGETRKFLEDGDEVILRATCHRPGAARIGFGECRGVVVPAES
ncbi:MAG TPA: fumarylacetoacetase [Gemmatimonadales bacterium]|nr:fumarylacetoacetase [Gemmatimonadales bacterium]